MQTDWTDIANIAVASLALIVSALSFLNSHRALRLSREQEARRQPNLEMFLLDSYNWPTTIGTNYAFRIAISNPTDTDNAVVRFDLEITYTRDGPSQTTVCIGNLHDAPRKDLAPTLPTPCRIDAHQAIEGWCYFICESDILSGAAIEGYAVLSLDTHGLKTRVQPIVIRPRVPQNVSQT